MGKKKDREKQPVAPPPLAPVVHSQAEPEEHSEVVAAKQRAKAAAGSVFGQDAARLRRELFGAE